MPQADLALIEERILTVRGLRVILDTDLARLYGVKTKALNQAVKRNSERFPADFLFQLSPEEKTEVVTNCDHLRGLRFAKSLPYAFTEYGALMAANVLNSVEAAKMSIYIIRAFVKMREHLAANAAILKRLAEIDSTLLLHDAALRDVYQKLLPLLTPPAPRRKKRIGYHP
jgi:hypothetical protein